MGPHHDLILEMKFLEMNLHGDMEGAKGIEKHRELFEDAKKFAKDNGLEETLNYVLGIHRCGMFFTSEKELQKEEAFQYLDEGKKGYESLGLTDTVFYGMCCFQAAMAWMQTHGTDDKEHLSKIVEYLECAVQGWGDNAVLIRNQMVDPALAQFKEALEMMKE